MVRDGINQTKSAYIVHVVDKEVIILLIMISEAQCQIVMDSIRCDHAKARWIISQCLDERPLKELETILGKIKEMKKVVISVDGCESGPDARLCPIGKDVVPNVPIQGTDVERF